LFRTLLLQKPFEVPGLASVVDENSVNSAVGDLNYTTSSGFAWKCSSKLEDSLTQSLTSQDSSNLIATYNDSSVGAGGNGSEKRMRLSVEGGASHDASGSALDTMHMEHSTSAADILLHKARRNSGIFYQPQLATSAGPADVEASSSIQINSNGSAATVMLGLTTSSIASLPLTKNIPQGTAADYKMRNLLDKMANLRADIEKWKVESSQQAATNRGAGAGVCSSSGSASSSGGDRSTATSNLSKLASLSSGRTADVNSNSGFDGQVAKEVVAIETATTLGTTETAAAASDVENCAAVVLIPLSIIYAVRWKNLVKDILKLPIDVVCKANNVQQNISLITSVLQENNHFFGCDLGNKDEQWPEFLDLQMV
jgi:hypothetical protein